MVHALQKFRDLWEAVTQRSQDLGDPRLHSETMHNLRGLLKYFYSEGAKVQAKEWLMDLDSAGRRRVSVVEMKYMV